MRSSISGSLRRFSPLALIAGSSNSPTPFLRGEIDSKKDKFRGNGDGSEICFQYREERVNPAEQSALNEISACSKSKT